MCDCWSMLLGKPSAYDSAESLRCLPLCCSPELRCPNCLWIFLRLQFAWSFFVFRMANSNFPASLRLQYHLINTFVKGDSLSPYLEEALPFCPFGTFPHTVGNHPLRRAEPARPQSPAACNFAMLLHHWLYFYGTEFWRSANVASCPDAFFA